MSTSDSLLCWVMNTPSQRIFPVVIKKDAIWGGVKDDIKVKKQPEFDDIAADALDLWKVTMMSSQRKSLLGSAQYLASILATEPLDPIVSVLKDFHPPPKDHIHILIVRRPRSVTTGTMTASYSDPTLSLDRAWARRPTTVEGIYSILNSARLVQVRGTPGSGKTIILKLLRKHILNVDPSAVVHVIWSWRNDVVPTSYEPRLSARLPGIAFQGEGDESMEKTYILFDNGQDTYWDTELWENFFKDQQQRPNGYRVILFCSYGSASKRMVDYDHGTPSVVRPNTRISLRRTTVVIDCEPIGLLLNREEFNDVVKRSAVVLLDPDLQDFIFGSTDGHVGAVMNVLEALSMYRLKQRNNVVLSIADFKAIDKSAFWLNLEYHSAFGRGLPTREELCKIGVADVFRNLLINESIDRESGRGLQYDEAVKLCHKNGWIQSDAIDEEVYYVLASPLHEAYLSWSLMPSDVVIPHDTILDLAIAVISQFSPSQLLKPPRRMKGTGNESLPEAQYQKEFYRGLFEMFGGAFRSPEYGTERGTRQGGIDFFIDVKKWGIALVRDRKEHDSRFEETGAYGVWLPTDDMLDYLILDFRRTQPIVTHDIPHLYHVVFDDDYTRFKILDNNLCMLHESGLVKQ